MPSGALQVVEFPKQITSLPPEIKHAGCPLRVIRQAIISQQICTSNNLILNSLKDILSAENLTQKKFKIYTARIFFELSI
jgi:hypothetical protein